MTARATAVPTCEPNVTPMLDVLLVLLIVFMTAIIQVHHTIDAVLPQPCPGSCGGADAIVLEALPGPTFRINQKPVTKGDLLGSLTAIYSGRPEKIIQVAGYPGVRYDDVVAAMDLAKSAGVRVVGLTLTDTRARGSSSTPIK